MLKNLLTLQQAVENDFLLSRIFFNLQEQIVLGYSSQIFLSSTTSIFILSKTLRNGKFKFLSTVRNSISEVSKFATSCGVLNPNFEIKSYLNGFFVYVLW